MLPCRIVGPSGGLSFTSAPSMLRYFDVIAPSLALARDDGHHARLLKTLARVELLILDGVDGLTSTAS